MQQKLAIVLGCIGFILLIIGIAMSFQAKEERWDKESENSDIKD